MQISEKLMNVGGVPVGRSWPAIAPILESGLKFGIQPDLFVQVSVKMKEITLQEVTVVILRPGAQFA